MLLLYPFDAIVLSISLEPDFDTIMVMQLIAWWEI